MHTGSNSCARTMIAIGNAPGDSMVFMYHAKATFNREFEYRDCHNHVIPTSDLRPPISVLEKEE
jgi:hypothetical protein